jgi:Holliday junction resolvase RusA-like endonuclease
MIEVVLAGAPMGKERVRFVRATGRTFTPERTVNYESRLALAAQQAMAGRPLFEGALQVDIVALMPVAESKPAKWKADALAGLIRPTKKPDWDNFGKILDALNMVVWVDDAQIVRGEVLKFYSNRPMMAVRVMPLVGASPMPAWVHKHAITEGIFS